MANKPTQKIVSKKHLARVERERRQNRLIVITAVVTLVIVFGVILFGVLQETVLKQRQPVAKVGSDVITTEQFQNQVRYTRYQLIDRYNSAIQLMQFFGNDTNFQQQVSELAARLQDPVTLGNDVLDQMIDDLVVRQEAEKRGITVTKAEVDEMLESAFGYFPNGSPTPSTTPTEGFAGFPSPGPTQLALVTITPTPTTGPTNTPEATATLAVTPTPEPTSGPTATPTVDPGTATPAPTATPYTAEGYQTAIKNYLGTIELSAFSEKDLYRIVETQLLRTKLAEQVIGEMNLQPTTEKVWARHILVPDKAVADLVIGRLENGEDFGKLAAEFSTDTSNKDNGGDLGWFGKGAMVAEFENAAFALNIGQISTPVQTTFGFHIIQVLDKQTFPMTSEEFTALKETKFSEWLTTAKEGVTIEKKDYWADRVPTDPVFDPNAA